MSAIDEIKRALETCAKRPDRMNFSALELMIATALADARRDGSEATLAEIEAQEPLFYYRPINGGLYEGPHWAKSICGKMQREERPGEWVPLYASPVPAQAVPDGWRPMHSAPRDGTAVLALLDGSDVAHAVRWLPDGNKFSGAVGWHVVWDLSAVAQHDGPNHWMPIPAAPEAAR